ncbi:RING finger and WD repeat domain-containing protein 3 [Mortierella alpina]|uniref:RING-type E3 ubiquitin transferase n=1 Tax=Mortierella alpina TaxID=64518 RepID=A0A9P6M2C0_MORAP|nr:RING finger and WD repeat domain-containing protein 3 [Mortierella alpina]
MNDFADVQDAALASDIDNDSGEDSGHAGIDEVQILQQPPEEAQSALEHSTPSQDQDFQSQVQVVIRPRAGAGENLVPEPRPRNIETEESTCSICFEPWTNSGIHRLVSIKCGHLFGENCILKWIAQHSRDGVVKCPECNHPAKRKDVRRIWSKSVVVLDTVEKEEAYSRVKKEQELRMRCEKDLAHSRMAYEMLKAEMTKLQKKCDRQRALKRRYRLEVQRLKLTNPETDIVKKFAYQPLRTIPVSASSTGMAHYLSYRPDEEMLVCSRQINTRHGIAKVSMRDYSNNLNDFIPIHTQAIRDVQCYNVDPFANKSLVLTASMDKTLKISSTASQQVVLTYDLQAPVWSCCWSRTNPFTVYCSVKGKQTGILTLDLRNTKAPVAVFSQPSLIGHSPIHSMSHIGPSQSQAREAILCGNLEGAFIYNFDSDSPFGSLSQDSITSGSQGSVSGQHVGESAEPRRVPLRLQGASCSSVSFDPVSRHWMASYKFLGSPFTQHIRGTLEIDTFGGELELKSEYRVTGGQPVSSMSRTTIFSRLNGAVHMAAGSMGMSYVWYDALKSSTPATSTCVAQSGIVTTASQVALAHGNASMERVVLEMPESNVGQGRAAIKDMKPVVVGVDEFLVALSDKELELYRWADITPHGDADESDEMDGDEGGSEPEREEDYDSSNKGKRRRVGDHGGEDESRAANVMDVADITIDDTFAE